MKLDAKKILIGGAILAVLWYFLTQTRRLDVGAAAISRLGLDGANLRINVKIPIINRSDIPVPITGFLGALLYGGSQIGTTQLTGQGTLGGRSETALEFTTVVSLLSVALSTPLLSILNGLAKKYLNVSLPGIPADPLDANTLPNAVNDIRIRGTLYVGALGIDINQPLTV